MRFSIPFILALILLPIAHAGDGSPSRKIDSFIAELHAKKGVTANPLATDEVFLKRIYLEVAGRLPSASEARSFLDSDRPLKREQLVDQLLASDDYSHNFFNYWADILRVTVKRKGSGGGYGEFAGYLMAALRENRPYDQMVREMVAAQGLIAENGAAVYTKRDFAMPLDNLASTVRVFLGVRLECAQCHDDPFGEWTQQDFYKMAAYSYGFKNVSSRSKGSIGRVHKRLIDNHLDPKTGRRVGEVNALDRTWKAMVAPWSSGHTTGTRFNGGQLRLPHDYQYDDAKPESPVKPKTIFGEAPEIDHPKKRIDRYAEWMTAPENPTFTRVIVNRLWERVFGVRLHAISAAEKIDDMSLDSESLHPELFEFLVGQMRTHRYDLRKFLGILYKSKLYQRAANTEDTPPDIREYAFPGPVLKRASAEQIWDSLVSLINPRPNDGDWVTRMGLEVRLGALNEYHHAISNWDEDLLYDAILRIRKDMKAEQVLIDARIAQITKDHQGSKRELGEKLRRLKKAEEFVGQRGFVERHVYQPALAAAGPRARFSVRLPDGRGELEIREEWKTLGSKPLPAFMNHLNQIRNEFIQQEFKRHEISRSNDQREYRRYRGSATRVYRAADLDLPAPPGHFMRKFGQADRQLIENSTREASLIQPLALMNERTVDLLRSRFSPLSLALARTAAMEDKIETIYLSLLARRPTAEEWSILKQESQQRGEGFAQDLVAALLNTGEFLFVR